MKASFTTLHYVVFILVISVNTYAQNPELIVQTGPENIFAMALSPDGQTLATGGRGTTLKLWDASKGRELRSISVKADIILSIAFSPDGKLLANAAAGNNQSFIEIWDVVTGHKVRTLNEHRDRVVVVAFSPDGRVLVSGSADKTVKVWDVRTGDLVHNLTGHTGGIWSLAFSPDGKTLASGGDDNKIKLWDISNGKKLRTLEGHTNFIPALAFSPDNQMLASGSVDTTVKLWNVAKGKILRTLKGHTKSVNAVSFNPNGRTLATGGSDTTIKLWDISSGQEQRALKGDINSVRAILFSPDGQLIFTGGDGATIKVLDAVTGTERQTLAGLSASVQSLAFSPDGRKLVSGGGGDQFNKDLLVKMVKLWSTSSGKELRPLIGHTGLVNSVAFNPISGRIIASAGWDNVIKIWDAETGKALRTLTGHKNTINQVAFSHEGRILASAAGGPTQSLLGEVIKNKSEDNTIRLWDVETGQELRIIQGHPIPVFTIAFSPDGRYLASGANYGAAKNVTPRLENLRQLSAIKVWEVATGREVGSFESEDNISPVVALAFSPDGKILASGGYGKTISLWNTATRTKLYTLTGHSGSVNSLRFTQDGRMLASGSDDRTIKLWDIGTGRELHTLAGHSGSVQEVAFSPNSGILASGSNDASIKLWDIDNGKELASLLAINQHDWLVVTPDGLFDASPAAWKHILWRFSENTFDVLPLEAFFNEFYHPDLLTDILAGKRPQAKSSIAQLDRRQAELRMSLGGEQAIVNEPISSRSITVKLTILTAPAGARDVRLFRNGSLVRAWRGNVTLDHDGTARMEASIPIVAGENRLTAYVFNRDNIKSDDATLQIAGAESLRRKGTAYILAIGINQYANQQYNLKYAVADAQLLSEELLSRLSRLDTFSNIEIIPLLNQSATKNNILLAVKRLSGDSTGMLPATAPPQLNKLKPAQPEDTVVIYFAGHGTAWQNQFYLIPHDLGYTGARIKLDSGGLQQILTHSISDRDLEQAFGKVDAEYLLLIIDACNSGQALEAEEKRRGPMNSKGLAQLAYEKGMYILTAAQGYQAAIETAQLGHGYLTYALVEDGLKTERADIDPRDGQVTAREWLDFAAERVPQMQQQLPHSTAVVPTVQAQPKPAIPQRTQGRRRGQQQQSSQSQRKLVQEDAPSATQNAPEDRLVQRPRVFYRREVEPQPLVVARP